MSVFLDPAALGLAAGGAAFWLVYFDLKDALAPEPRWALVGAFALGLLAPLPAIGIYRLAPFIGLPAAPPAGEGAVLLYCLLVVAPIEEGVKFAVARGIVFRWRSFDERLDGMVYAACVAIGFATTENLLYAPHLEPLEQAARALAAPLVHALFAVIWGFGCTQAMLGGLGRVERWAWQAGTLVLAMLAHGLYDFFLLAWSAPLVSSGLVLALWILLIWYAKRLLRAEKARRRATS